MTAPPHEFAVDFGSYRWAEALVQAGFPVQRSTWSAGVWRERKDDWPPLTDADQLATDWQPALAWEPAKELTYRGALVDRVNLDPTLAWSRFLLLDLLAAIAWFNQLFDPS